MLIPRFRGQKLPKYDLKAGRQIFDKEYERRDGYRVSVSPDAENPIDIRLRQMAISSLDGTINLKQEFLEKWVALEKDGEIVVGRIKDLYLSTRDIRIRDRKGKDVFASLDDVIEYSESEP
jgi:hypothetical protein